MFTSLELLAALTQLLAEGYKSLDVGIRRIATTGDLVVLVSSKETALPKLVVRSDNVDERNEFVLGKGTSVRIRSKEKR